VYRTLARSRMVYPCMTGLAAASDVRARSVHQLSKRSPAGFATSLKLANGQKGDSFCTMNNTPVGFRSSLHLNFDIALHRLHFRRLFHALLPLCFWLNFAQD
jgi:hypothetical protein